MVTHETISAPVAFDEWEQHPVESTEPVQLSQAVGPGLRAYAHVEPRPGATALVCFLPSAQADTRPQVIPSFNRWTWGSALPDAHVVALSDPALTVDGDLRACWFLHPDVDLVAFLAEFSARIARKLGVAEDRVAFYGSSMGGFGALAMASRLRGALALAEIPQIDLRHWLGTKGRALRQHITGPSLEEYFAAHPEQVQIQARFKHSGRVPPFVIITNRSDRSYADQVGLMDDLPQLADGLSVLGDQTLLATGVVDGHTPVPKAYAIARIRAALASG